MRTFFCLTIMIVLAHFGMKIGLLWIILIPMLLIAFFQDCKELARK